MLAPGGPSRGHREPCSFHSPVGLPDAESLSLRAGQPLAALLAAARQARSSCKKLAYKLWETQGWYLVVTNLRLSTRCLINNPILPNPCVLTFGIFCPFSNVDCPGILPFCFIKQRRMRWGRQQESFTLPLKSDPAFWGHLLYNGTQTPFKTQNRFQKEVSFSMKIFEKPHVVFWWTFWSPLVFLCPSKWLFTRREKSSLGAQSNSSESHTPKRSNNCRIIINYNPNPIWLHVQLTWRRQMYVCAVGASVKTFYVSSWIFINEGSINLN